MFEGNIRILPKSTEEGFEVEISENGGTHRICFAVKSENMVGMAGGEWRQKNEHLLAATVLAQAILVVDKTTADASGGRGQL